MIFFTFIDSVSYYFARIRLIFALIQSNEFIRKNYLPLMSLLLSSSRVILSKNRRLRQLIEKLERSYETTPDQPQIIKPAA